MRRLVALSLATSLLLSGAAMAQDQVVVNLSDISTELATELDIDAAEVPSTISVNKNVASQVCDDAVNELGDTCTAKTFTSKLIEAIESDLDDDEGTANPNSAKEYAPGQQDGPARDSAPGQQDGDARDSAPGQQKKD